MLQDAWYLYEEVGLLHFFFGSAPGDIIRKEMCEQGLGQVNRETTKEKKTSNPISDVQRVDAKEQTHKNGIQVKFSAKDGIRLRWPIRYSNRV